MPITLPPELESRFAALAERDGVTPDELAAEVVKQHLEDEKIAALDALIESWLADPSDQIEVGELLVTNIDANRPGQRPHFPPERKGQSW